MSKSTLSSVVSSLVRASVGIAMPDTVPDEDLDKHVAELILKEAKQKADNYSQLGIKAYLPTGPDPNAPRPNKRFLSSIIRSTDDHNKTILRAQALAAQEIKKERDEQERRERRARAEEAAAAERSRRRRRRDDYESDEWDPRKVRVRRGSRPDSKSWESDWKTGREDESERERRHRRSMRCHRSRSVSQERARTRDRRHRISHERTSKDQGDNDSPRGERSRRKHARRESRDEEKKHKRRRRTSRSPSLSEPLRTTTPHRHTRSVSLSDDQDTQAKRPAQDRALQSLTTPSRSSQTPIDDDTVDVDVESSRVSKGKERDTGNVSSPASPPRIRSPSPAPRPPVRRPRGRATLPTSVRSPSVSPPPLPPAALPSKMDKYFEDSYDPRFDVAPLPIPTVPQTGLINDSEYEAWDAMLELLRQRREDKEERKRLEKLGFDTSDKKIPTSKLKKHSEGGDSIMEIEYKKKGSIREWDLGKEGF